MRNGAQKTLKAKLFFLIVVFCSKDFAVSKEKCTFVPKWKFMRINNRMSDGAIAKLKAIALDVLNKFLFELV